VYLKLIKELEQLRAKWTTIHTKFREVQEQPGKKLDAEFDTLHGQTLTDLDKIQRGVKKLKLESAEPRNIKSLLDKCVVSLMIVSSISSLTFSEFKKWAYEFDTRDLNKCRCFSNSLFP